MTQVDLRTSRIMTEPDYETLVSDTLQHWQNERRFVFCWDVGVGGPR